MIRNQKLFKHLLTVVMAVIMVLHPFIGNIAFAMGKDDDSSNVHPTFVNRENDLLPQSGTEVMYFGTVKEITQEGYQVSTVPIEVSYRDKVTKQEQDKDLVEVHVKSYTDTVTTNGSDLLQPGAPVVVAGFENGGVVDALVIGNMYAAEILDPEGNPMETVQKLAVSQEKSETEKKTIPDHELVALNTESKQMQSTSSNQNDEPVVLKRMTSIKGEHDYMREGEDEFPAFAVGPLKISMYVGYYAGADMTWDFPYEVQAKLYDPLRLVTLEDKYLKEGESVEDRLKRLANMSALMKVYVVPKGQEENRTFLARAGLKLKVGFRGEILGYSFDKEIDITRTATSALGVGEIGLNVQAGGKHPGPGAYERTAFGVRQNVSFNEDILECSGTSCEINAITEDAIGIKLPFYETGPLSFSLEVTPAVVVHGGWPELVNWKATNGLVVEAYTQYDTFGERNFPSPVVDPAISTPIDSKHGLDDAFLLRVDEPYVENLGEGFDLSFEYDPGGLRATFGLIYQVEVSVDATVGSASAKLPFLFLEIPFGPTLDSENGVLSCESTEKEIKDCQKAAFHFSVESLVMPMGISGDLPPVVSGTHYDSGELKATGGTGQVELTPVGALLEGLTWQKTGTDAWGNNTYKLEGTTHLREGEYTIEFRATDEEGGERIIERKLEVYKMYPENIYSEVVIGQQWREKLRLVKPDGTVHTGINWQLNGLPGDAYTIDDEDYLNINTSTLNPGRYGFNLQVNLNGKTYETVKPHQLIVQAREITPKIQWKKDSDLSIGVHPSFGNVMYHEELGELAVLLRETVSLKKGREYTFNIVGETPDFTDYPSLSYVYPESENERGWMYILGGKSDDGGSPVNLYRLDEQGFHLVYDASSALNYSKEHPYVYDAMSAAFPDGRLLVFGGSKDEYHVPVADTWLYDPGTNQFEKLQLNKHPEARSGANSMVYIPELKKAVMVDGQVWLFDPDKLQWQTVDKAGYGIKLDQREDTHLVYSRLEQKLYIFVTGVETPFRLYSIQIENGKLGPIIIESLPVDILKMDDTSGKFAYHENLGQLLFASGGWYAQLPQASRDQENLIADGKDDVRFKFPAASYLKNPNDWWIDWKKRGRIDLTQGKGTFRTTVDSDGIVTLDITYEDFALNNDVSGKLMIYAVNKQTGKRVALGFASVPVHPVPADPEKSSLDLAQNVQDYLADTEGTRVNPEVRIVPMKISLRSKDGVPLPGRRLTLPYDEALRLSNNRQGIYIGHMDAGIIPSDDLDSSKRLFPGADGPIMYPEQWGKWPYKWNVETDENGEVALYHATTLPGPEKAGVYPFYFELLDGSGMKLATSMKYKYRQFEPERHSYAIDAFTGRYFSGKIDIKGISSWSYNWDICQEDDPFTCFGITEGRLPNGVILNRNTGKISGKPQETGLFHVKVHLPYQTAGEVDLKLNVNEPLTLDPAYEQWQFNGKVGESFNANLKEKVSGGIAPYEYEFEYPPGYPEKLPEGLTFDPRTGELSGTFTETGFDHFKVKIINADGIEDNEHKDFVVKDIKFNIQEQEPQFYSYRGPLNGLKVSDNAGVHMLSYQANPIGVTGDFTPIEGGFFKLMRPVTTTPVDFELSYDLKSIDKNRGSKYQYSLYYWNPQTEEWTAFADQSLRYGETLKASITTPQELENVWQRSVDTYAFNSYFYKYYDFLYIAVGIKKKEVQITDIQITDQQLTDFSKPQYIELKVHGQNLEANPTVYVGGREALQTFVYTDYKSGESYLVVDIPPGEGTKNIRVVNDYGTSEGYPFTYPIDMRLSQDEVRLQVTMYPKEDLYDGALVVGEEMRVRVELVNLQGERVRPEDVRADFSKRIILTSLTDPMKNYPMNELVAHCVDGSTACEEDWNHLGSYVSGYLNDDGAFEASLKFLYDEDDADLVGSLEDGQFPDEGIADIAVTIPEEGIYDRIRVGTTPKQKAEYVPLKITTARERTAEVDQPFHLQLEATGGITESYRWHWSAQSTIPPGFVLDEETGELRDWQQGDDEGLIKEKQPGTYVFDLVLTDGVSAVSKKFILTVTGEPTRSIQLDDLAVYGGDTRALLDIGFDPQKTSYQLEVNHEMNHISILPTIGDYTVTMDTYQSGGSVTDEVYQNVTTAVYVEADGVFIPPNKNGEFELDINVGWNSLNVFAVANDDGDMILQNYSLMFNREPSPAISKIFVHPDEEPIIQLDGGEGASNFTVQVPNHVDHVRIEAYTKDDQAWIEINGKSLLSAIKSQPITLQDNVTNIEMKTHVLGDWSIGEIGKTYTITVQKIPSDQNKLERFIFSPSILTGSFDPAITDYQAQVHFGMDHVWMHAKADETASINVFVNGNEVVPEPKNILLNVQNQLWYPIYLQVGDNTVEIKVTAENGAQKTYTTQIERKKSSNAWLKSMQLQPVSLTNFDSYQLEYEVSVRENVEQATMKLQPDDSRSTWAVLLNGDEIKASNDLYELPLNRGINIATVQVKAPDGITTRTYRVLIKRAFEDLPTPSKDKRSQSSSQNDDHKYYVGLDGRTIFLKGWEVNIPQGAMNVPFYLTIEEAEDLHSLPLDEHEQFIGTLIKLSKNVKSSFLKDIRLRYHSDSTQFFQNDKQLRLVWLDEETREWKELNNINEELDKGSIGGTIDHLGMFAVIAAAKEKGNLKDIKGHWAEENIKHLVEKGVISGYPDDTFKPNKVITRAEFTTILVRALGLTDQMDKLTDGKRFADTADHWAKDFIALAYRNGIVKGYNENIFGVNDPLTREQMVVIILRAMELTSSIDGEQTVQDAHFTDHKLISDWAKKAVEKAFVNGIIKGDPDGDFHPQRKATRAEAAVILDRILK